MNSNFSAAQKPKMGCWQEPGRSSQELLAAIKPHFEEQGYSCSEGTLALLRRE